MKKKLVILANSAKHYPMTCVAGRELLVDEQHPSGVFGPWVRPISNHDEGALNWTERRLSDGKAPKPLDIVDLNLADNEGNALQPENWRIVLGDRWVDAGAVGIESIRNIEEKPDNLWWDEQAARSDQARPIFLQQLTDLSSLYIIKPEHFRIEIRAKVWDGKSKNRTHAIFDYRGRHYDLSLTDPLIGEKYYPNLSQMAEGYIDLESKSVFLCVSLTPPFNNLHYKVVATVFELAP